MIDTLYMLIVVLLTLSLIQGQRTGESKKSCDNYLINFKSIRIESDLLLRLVGVMNLILILSLPFSILMMRENPTYVIFVSKELTLACIH